MAKYQGTFLSSNLHNIYEGLIDFMHAILVHGDQGPINGESVLLNIANK